MEEEVEGEGTHLSTVRAMPPIRIAAIFGFGFGLVLWSRV